MTQNGVLRLAVVLAGLMGAAGVVLTPVMAQRSVPVAIVSSRLVTANGAAPAPNATMISSTRPTSRSAGRAGD